MLLYVSETDNIVENIYTLYIIGKVILSFVLKNSFFILRLFCVGTRDPVIRD